MTEEQNKLAEETMIEAVLRRSINACSEDCDETCACERVRDLALAGLRAAREPATEAVRDTTVGGCGVCAGPALKFGTGCTLPNCPYTALNLVALLRESLPYVAMKLSTADLVERIENALKGKGASQGAGEQKPYAHVMGACPLCGRTDPHSHTSGPMGMS